MIIDPIDDWIHWLGDPPIGSSTVIDSVNLRCTRDEIEIREFQNLVLRLAFLFYEKPQCVLVTRS